MSTEITIGNVNPSSCVIHKIPPNPQMFRRTSFQPILNSVTIVLGLLSLLPTLQGAARDKSQLRFICVSSLSGEQEIVLAARNEKGRWKEWGAVGLRASAITDWLPAEAGELHLAMREKDALKSICSFQFPADSRRVLVALVADTETNSYKAHVCDLGRLGFAKGSVLVVNFSPQAGMVSLGSNEQKVEAGREAVIKPGADQDGTYRMLVSSLEEGGKPVPCHDRHVLGNPESREILFILPDKALSLRVATIPIFGTLD
jgi:hypothetical protein